MLKTNSTFSAKSVTIIDKLIIKLGDSNQPSLCLLQEQMPLIYRITKIVTSVNNDGSYETTAQIFHEKAVLEVQWNSPIWDTRLSDNDLVSVRWKGKLTTNNENIVISRLVPISSVQPLVNVFDTVPNDWCKDRALISRVKKLFEVLSTEYKNVFNTIFWDSNRLFSLVNSNSFISAVENCERVMKYQYRGIFDIDKSVIILLLNTLIPYRNCNSLGANLTNNELRIVPLHEFLFEKVMEAKIVLKDKSKAECWTELLRSLDY